MTYYWTQQSKSFKKKEVLGEKIGKGFYREVYQYTGNTNWVIKVIRPNRKKCLHENKTEYENWSNLREVSLISKLLTPVVDMSTCGRFLLMEKTEPLGTNDIEKLPKYAPVGYYDGHINQLSKLNNKIVIHDYGCNLLKPRLRRVTPNKFWN